MSLEKCGCGSSKVKIKKEKVSAAVAECGSCGTVGPTAQAETHDEAELAAEKAWNAVRSMDPSNSPVIDQ